MVDRQADATGTGISPALGSRGGGRSRINARRVHAILGHIVRHSLIRVGQSFIQAWGNWKSGGKRSENEAAYRLTGDIQSIFDFEDLEINPAPDDTTLQVFINRKSYVLSELGSGLTQFILVLANAAVRKPSYILIDEPELNLHPSLQLDFLTTLASYAEHGIMFGTHSIGLARASAERIYALQKVTEGESRLSDFDGMRSLAEFLGEMSFSGYSELGFK